MRGTILLKRALAAALGFCVVCCAPVARADEALLVGTVGAASAAPWPVYIGMAKKFFADAGLGIDLIFAPSVAALMQQLTGGSLNIVVSAGLTDPILAVDHGAPVAIVRIEGQVSPYALIADARIKTIEALKGKTISIDEPKGITRTYLERMLVPHGLKRGDYDLVFAGATSARYAALQSHAVDAAMLTTPYNFQAQSAGYSNLGFVRDYVTDIPFSGMVVDKRWTEGNKERLQKFLAAYTRSILWFYDDRSRDEAIKILVDSTKQSPSNSAIAYDFFRKIEYFERTGRVSMTSLGNLAKSLQGVGDIEISFDINRLIMPGVTEIAGAAR
ncbi:MAG TPA: ABC transporter substrate-binding protein [Stellaceae bacterium]|nr:ABC transporter substrate-binding protein [Stellaceae bacterium]